MTKASELATRPGDIGALGDLTFVDSVIIVERVDSREFFTLDGQSLGKVTQKKNPPVAQEGVNAKTY